MRLRFLLAVHALFNMAFAGSAAIAETPRLKFLSDTDEVYKELEIRQGEAYRRDPKRSRWQGTPEEYLKIENLYDQLFPEAGPSVSSSLKLQIRKRLSEPLPTRWEDPLPYAITRLSTENILSAAKSLKLDVPNFPRFGTIPIQEINAEAIPFLDSYIVVINSRTYSFCHELTKIAAATIEFKNIPGTKKLSIDFSEEAFRRRIKDDPTLRRRFEALLFEFTTKSSPTFDARPGEHEAPLIVPLVRAMELFIVGHEYTHVLLEHEPVGGIGKKLALVGSEDLREIEAIRRSWEQELHADAGGIALMNHALEMEWKEDKPEYRKPFLDHCVRYAPILYFQFAEILDEAKYINAHRHLPTARPKAEEDKVWRVVGDANELRKQLSDVLSLRNANENRNRRENEKSMLAQDPITSGLGDHPPPWLRRKLIETAWVAGTPERDSDQQVFAQLAEATGRNIRLLWDDIKPLYLKQVEAADHRPK